MKLSVTIITLNEEKALGDCLRSLAPLKAEIIVIDSGSTDNTVTIAKDYGAQVFEHPFNNFADQKNYAVSRSKGEWIFSIDADEEITDDLAKEILEAIKDNECSGYLIPRRNFIFGAEIKYSRWSPDKHIWLWKKDAGSWLGDVHEEVVVKGAVKQLYNPKIHHQSGGVADFIGSNDRYSTLMALDMYKKHIRFSIFKMAWDVIFEFGVRYIYKIGFLDGWRGLVLAILMSYYKLQVWIKLLKLQIAQK